MDKLSSKKKRLSRRRSYIKKKIRSRAGKLRLCINRSNKNFYAQIVDDEKGLTLLGISTLAKDFPDMKSKGNIAAAKELGRIVAEKAKEKGITTVVFDRNGILYHGKIKALAEAARENGLEF